MAGGEGLEASAFGLEGVALGEKRLSGNPSAVLAGVAGAVVAGAVGVADLRVAGAVASFDSGLGGGGGSRGIDGRRLPGFASAPRLPDPGDGKSGRLNLSVPIGGSVTLVGE